MVLIAPPLEIFYVIIRSVNTFSVVHEAFASLRSHMKRQSLNSLRSHVMTVFCFAFMAFCIVFLVVAVKTLVKFTLFANAIN